MHSEHKTSPLILFVPGEEGPTPTREMARTLPAHLEGVTLELGNWHNPHRNTWVNRLNLIIGRAQRPVVVVADGLACLALIWWATFEQPGPDLPVAGAALIDPPDLDRPGTDLRLARFGAIQPAQLPFPAILFADRDGCASRQATHRRLAADWNCVYLEWDGKRSAASLVLDRLGGAGRANVV